MIFIEGDVRNITNVLTSWRTIERDFGRRGLGLEVIADLSTEVALQSFAEFADRKAASDAPALGHMYEWGKLGEESGRLWRLIATGTTQNKLATFDYKEAQRETPRGVNPRDTRQEGHVFRWKAPIMELGIRTSQEPAPGRMLAIPTREPENTSGRKSRKQGGTMWFSRQSVTTIPDYAARGSFTELWMTYFATAAVRIVEETVVERVEQFLDSYEKVYRKFPEPKVRPKPMSAKLMVETYLGERYGRDKNMRFISKEMKAAQLLRAQRVADGL